MEPGSKLIVTKDAAVPKLLIATHNSGKLAEYRRILADLPITVRSLQDEGITFDAEETGHTFDENARSKARLYAHASQLLTWADDSGLEVDALDGRPGVHSARYGGPDATDRQRYELLLQELASVPEPHRTARFRCVVAIAIPGGRVLTAQGCVEGTIAVQPQGSHGFGYDPVFYLPGHEATMAELPPDVKNRISHRAKAAARAKTLLSNILSAE
jgi:XTP/dITP diphosphohydrolase